MKPKCLTRASNSLFGSADVIFGELTFDDQPLIPWIRHSIIVSGIMTFDLFLRKRIRRLTFTFETVYNRCSNKWTVNYFWPMFAGRQRNTTGIGGFPLNCSTSAELNCVHCFVGRCSLSVCTVHNEQMSTLSYCLCAYESRFVFLLEVHVFKLSILKTTITIK